jgi:hypothetical protein
MTRTGFVALVLSVLPVVGCSGSGGSEKTFITRYPRWEFQKYERIAVLPFATENPRAAEAARQAFYELEHLLAANGRFTVVSRSELAAVLEEQDFSRLADVVDPSTVIPAGRIQAVQALVVGKLTTVDMRAEKLIQRIPVYVRDNQGRIVRDRRTGLPREGGESVREIFVHSARVAGTIRVIDTATSQIIFSYSSPPIERDDSQAGAPPRASPEELAVEAARELATDCYTNVAPIRTEVKLKSKMLVIALGYYDGRYDEAGKIPTNLEQFMIAVRELPRECDRNPFRLTVTPEDGRENLFEASFVWSSANPVRGQQFNVPLEPLKRSGAARFVAKLYSGQDEVPILTRDFKLEVPKASARGRSGDEGKEARKDKDDDEVEDDRRSSV